MITKEMVEQWGVAWVEDNKFIGSQLQYIARRAAAYGAEQREKELMAVEMEPFGDWPEFHQQGLGCGLEDRCITDRYEAAEYGWKDCEERMLEQGPFYTAEQLAAARLQGAEEARARILNMTLPELASDGWLNAGNGASVNQRLNKAVEDALGNLLYWVERAVDKGNANSDIEEAMEQYNAAILAAAEAHTGEKT